MSARPRSSRKFVTVWRTCFGGGLNAFSISANVQVRARLRELRRRGAAKRRGFLTIRHGDRIAVRRRARFAQDSRTVIAFDRDFSSFFYGPSGFRILWVIPWGFESPLSHCFAVSMTHRLAGCSGRRAFTRTGVTFDWGDAQIPQRRESQRAELAGPSRFGSVVTLCTVLCPTVLQEGGTMFHSHQTRFAIETRGYQHMHDLTDQVTDIVQDSLIHTGIAHVFNIGSTGAIGTIEFEPGLELDLPQTLDPPHSTQQRLRP